MDHPPLRPLVWVGGSYKEYARFPRAVTRTMGHSLYQVQIGEEPHDEKPLSSGALKGLGIREIRDDFDRDTYRAVYTVNLEHAVYVLHAFKKKSKFGISTPNHDIDLIRQRYRDAQKLDQAYESLQRGMRNDE
jgi:phage-related protein